MTGTAWLTSLLICGLVWGGFLFLVSRALLHEGRKVGDAGNGDSHR